MFRRLLPRYRSCTSCRWGTARILGPPARQVTGRRSPNPLTSLNSRNAVMSPVAGQPTLASATTSMHRFDARSEHLLRSVLSYAENRLRMDPVPLDRGELSAAQLN